MGVDDDADNAADDDYAYDDSGRDGDSGFQCGVVC